MGVDGHWSANPDEGSSAPSAHTKAHPHARLWADVWVSGSELPHHGDGIQWAGQYPTYRHQCLVTVGIPVPAVHPLSGVPCFARASIPFSRCGSGFPCVSSCSIPSTLLVSCCGIYSFALSGSFTENPTWFASVPVPHDLCGGTHTCASYAHIWKGVFILPVSWPLPLCTPALPCTCPLHNCCDKEKLSVTLTYTHTRAHHVHVGSPCTGSCGQAERPSTFTTLASVGSRFPFRVSSLGSRPRPPCRGRSCPSSSSSSRPSSLPTPLRLVL